MRTIDYLRISVTDRCNLRCTYCMPEEGLKLKEHSEILSYEEIEFLVKSLAKIGFKKIRLTGGEPLVRGGISTLIRKLKDIPGIEDISLTTNGILLSKMSAILKESGLDRLNISLDTLNPEKFKKITRLGDIEKVFNGIDEAKRVGIKPIKINFVVIKGFNTDEIIPMVKFGIKKGVQVRFIELMPIGESDGVDKLFTIDSVKKIIESEFQLEDDLSIKTNGPAKNYHVVGTDASIGIIGAISNHFCDRCNRLRITADGKVRLCLHKDEEYGIRDLLETKDEKKVQEFFLKIIPKKPEKHEMEKGWGDQKRGMSQIGG